MKKVIFILMLILFASNVDEISAQSQKKDKGEVIEYKNEFWDEIKKSSEEFWKIEKKKKTAFKLDFSDYDLPKDIKEFKTQWHNPPISQGWSGMCWCFSTTSLFESEVKRIHNKELKFSELHTIYYEYLEKAKEYIKTRGKSLFAQGSQGNAVVNIWIEYGCVPFDSYKGMLKDQKYYDHHVMFKEMKVYLKSVKERNAWNEALVISTLKSILNKYIGTPPEYISVNGINFTPQEYLEKIVKLNMDDYVDILSLMEKPYWTKAEYPVPDNWWHSKNYHNVPLDDYMKTIKNIVKSGYTLFIGGDVSESGYHSEFDAAVVPSYDIPSEYIDENARQFRFSNKSTTDDHGIHIVGYKEDDGKFWFLIKDSGSGSRNGHNKGYYFYQEDYLKLKMMNIIVHKSAVQDLIKKF